MYKGLLIADLHIGVLPITQLYEEIKNTIFSLIEKTKYDFIIFLGDYFDHRLQLNEDNSLYSFMIMQEILKRCKKDIKIRMIYGTKSHEWDQYKILSRFSLDYDFHIITTVFEEELFPNMNVLYIPEEYVSDKGEYYNDYFSMDKKYDYIFGHGVIREVMKEASVNINNSSTGKRKKVPVFNTGELFRICKGQTYFGHYHVHTNINNRVFYVGSFSRWQFGEEEEKGIYEIQYNEKKGKYENRFIPNNSCEIFKTICFGYDSKIFKDLDTMEKKLNQIDNMIKNKIFDHVRFEFNIPKECKQGESIIKYLKERYRFKQEVKLEIVNGYIEEKREKERKEKEDILGKYQPLMDKNLNPEDKVSFFVGIEYNRKITPKRVSMYLYKKLEEILTDIESEVIE